LDAGVLLLKGGRNGTPFPSLFIDKTHWEINGKMLFTSFICLG
jgi:hypothetical protein